MTITLDRRALLFAGAVAGGGLWVGLDRAAAETAPSGAMNPWVTITANNRIIITAHNPEIGQGIKTSIPMLVAEELDVDWAQVEIVQALANAAVYGRQVAGGSMATTLQYDALRRVGAGARAMLINAAAVAWGVPAGEISTGGAMLRHQSGKSASYGSMAAAAAKLPPPEAAALTLKDPKSFKLVGTPVSGVDNRAIVTGKPLFGIDATLPGMKYAVYHKRGIAGAEVKSVDLAPVKARNGVSDAFVIAGNPDLAGGIAIIANSTWAALNAREALQPDWTAGDGAFQSTTAWAAMAAERKTAGPERTIVSDGDVTAALGTAARVVSADYAYPFLAHVPMEPMNCTAQVTGDRIEIWAPTQNPEPGRKAVARVLGVPEANITIHMLRCGGGFGRRLVNDFMVEAAIIARMAKAPVKLTWSREDDIAHDWLRPGGWHNFTAGLDAKGKIIAWDNHFISYGKAGKFARAAEIGGSDFPAKLFENFRVGASILPLESNTGYLRAPANNAFGFVTQGFIDELAHAAGQDPLGFRRTLLGEPRWLGDPAARGTYHTGRMRGVLDKAAAMAGWGRKLPPRTGLGIAFHLSHLGYFANVIEAQVAGDGSVRVNKVWVAGDVGRQIVNPSGALAQVQGSVLDALGAATGQAITFADGAVEQRNFGDYPLLRMDAVPSVEVAFVTTDYPVTGMGEPAYPAVAPALANAIFAATGVRLRALPFDTALLKS
jgi:isoquinoline 1-oxidoreductase beta subunit